ncbi:hypothetical protein [Pseudochryseolinea flava]|uniref:Uncharacterized protein n=1 Tax=Pseudochryseolinea flava TaxID=2059302 RepID=A0A364Y3K0_9BACT|nr:hypothetical protein [Pseudochryseolinea flava]RAW01299.1 hypothetical protein DQQ10_10340 [Pseudochryseolinea flava]
MSRKEIVDFIHNLEQKYPVDTWRVADVDVWPILKIQTFFFWFERNEQEKRNSPKKEKQIKTSSIRALVSSFLAWITFLFVQAKRTKYVFSGAHSYRVNFSDMSMNRYFDPMMDYLESEYDASCLQFEQDSLRDLNYYKRDRIVPLRKLFPLANAWVKATTRGAVSKQFSSLNRFNDCLIEIEHELPTLSRQFVKKQVVYMTQTILVWAFVFDRIFKRTKPDYAFGLCYYTLQMLGMNLSARRNEVVSIDMQHGTQGDLHVAYAHFTKMPTHGFSILPKVFWCWDQPSANVIQSWTSKQLNHNVIVGGNPWINFLADQHEVPIIRTSKKIILYTLQPVEPMLDDYILEAIKKTVSSYEWWIRLHPRQLKEKDRLIGILKKSGIERAVNIDDACQLPLPTILQHSAVHLSKFSGSIIEAGLLGVNNIVIDEIGVAAFKHELSNGSAVAYLEKDADGLIALITKLANMKGRGMENIKFADILRANFIA